MLEFVTSGLSVAISSLALGQPSAWAPVAPSMNDAKRKTALKLCRRTGTQAMERLNSRCAEQHPAPFGIFRRRVPAQSDHDQNRLLFIPHATVIWNPPLAMICMLFVQNIFSRTLPD